MSGDTIAVLGVGVTLLAAILTFGFALLGAHRATQATWNGRMDRMDQRFDRMDQRFDRVDQRFERPRPPLQRIRDRRLSDLRRRRGASGPPPVEAHRRSGVGAVAPGQPPTERSAGIGSRAGNPCRRPAPTAPGSCRQQRLAAEFLKLHSDSLTQGALSSTPQHEPCREPCLHGADAPNWCML